MDTEALIARFRQLGCTPTNRRDRYSSLLVRCDCGRHALAAAACRKKADEPVKLLGAALSWYAATNRKGPLTYVVGTDEAGKWRHAVQALRSLRPKTTKIELLVDFEEAPSWSADDLHDESWLRRMLNRRQLRLPPGAQSLEHRARKHGFKWYRSVTDSTWSGRLAGLEVCTLTSRGTRFLFSVGKPGKEDPTSGEASLSAAREAFLGILRTNAQVLGLPAHAESVSVGIGEVEKAFAVVELLASSELPSHGSAEHRLEAKVLRGDVMLQGPDGPLLPVEAEHPYQFPTRWWRKGRARYVDIMARRGSTPWLVELKVDVNQGEYYRDGIIQTALYLGYVLTATGLDPWFAQHGLEREKCRAALVVAPFHGADARLHREDHGRVARELGVDLIEEPAAALQIGP